jgi:hypothetical protein
MTLNDKFKQAVEFAADELQGFYDRGNSFSALNQKGRSEILEVFSDNFDWQFHLNKAADDFHSFDSLKRYCAHLTRTDKKMPDELKHWLADVLEGIQPALKPPRGGVATGLENNMLIPRLVEKVAIKFNIPRTRGENTSVISACDAVQMAIINVPEAREIKSRQYETIRKDYAAAKRRGIFDG